MQCTLCVMDLLCVCGNSYSGTSILTLCKNRIVNMISITCSWSFWLQMNEPWQLHKWIHIYIIAQQFIIKKLISHMIYFTHSLKRNDNFVIIANTLHKTCHSGCRWVNQLYTWTRIIIVSSNHNLYKHINVQWNQSNLFLHDEFICIHVCNWFTNMANGMTNYMPYWQSYFYSATICRKHASWILR